MTSENNQHPCARVESEAQVIDGYLVIRISTATLAHAARHSDYFDICEEDGSPVKITDEAAFAKSVASALNREDETGATPITHMFDDAFEHVVDQGMDGAEPA